MTVREVLRASLRLLERRDRRLLALAIAIQMTTALLDLLGVVLIGAVGALSVTSLQGQAPPRRVATVLSALRLDSLSQAALIAALGGAAALVLLAKSVISPLLMSRVLRFLTRREVAVSARMTRELLSRPLTFVQRRSTQETAAALIQGTTSATTVALGQMTVAAAETALLVVLSVALLVVNPLLALGVIAFFGLVGIGLQRVLGRRTAQRGTERVRADIASLRTLQEVLGAYREVTVADRRSFYVDRVEDLRAESTRASADQQFVNILPKYVSEAALVLGAFALAAVLFGTQPIGVAAGSFALFLAGATRVMPSLLRLQTATLTIRAVAGSAARTYALAEDLEKGGRLGTSGRNTAQPTPVLDERSDFRPVIDMRNVRFTYPGADGPALQDICLAVRAGRSVALVGRSGAGKSTLADVILGVLEPEEGTVTVSGVPPGGAVKRWPGRIGYVPQDVMLADESVRNNVALGLPRDLIDDDLVWEALRRAHLADYIGTQPEGLDTPIGERGLRLSGGQRQRLGIARALFTRPRLLVLDEATSSLDAETEQAITQMLDDLAEDVTTVIVAHRLSTVRHVDRVVYLEDSRIKAIGTFDDVCAEVPALQRQAELMGLASAG